MTRTKGAKNKDKKWTLQKKNSVGQVEEEKTFKNQKDIADYLNLSISIVKKYTCKKDRCKLKHKTTKERWGNIEIFKTINDEKLKSTLII